MVGGQGDEGDVRAKERDVIMPKEITLLPPPLCLAFAGSSGTGKSTLANAIAYNALGNDVALPPYEACFCLDSQI